MTRLFLNLAVALAFVGALAGFVNSASAKPSWLASDQCVLDDGYNRYRSCSAGGE